MEGQMGLGVNMRQARPANPDSRTNWNDIKPFGMPYTIINQEFFPASGKKVFFPNDKIKFMLYGTSGFWNPYSAYIEVEVEFPDESFNDPTFDQCGQFKQTLAEQQAYRESIRKKLDTSIYQLDGTGQSIISLLSVKSNNIEVERLEQHDVLSQVLYDMNMGVDGRKINQNQGLGWKELGTKQSIVQKKLANLYWGQDRQRMTDLFADCKFSFQNDDGCADQLGCYTSGLVNGEHLTFKNGFFPPKYPNGAETTGRPLKGPQAMFAEGYNGGDCYVNSAAPGVQDPVRYRQEVSKLGGYKQILNKTHSYGRLRNYKQFNKALRFDSLLVGPTTPVVRTLIEEDYSRAQPDLQPPGVLQGDPSKKWIKCLRRLGLANQSVWAQSWQATGTIGINLTPMLADQATDTKVSLDPYGYTKKCITFPLNLFTGEILDFGWDYFFANDVEELRACQTLLTTQSAGKGPGGVTLDTAEAEFQAKWNVGGLVKLEDLEEYPWSTSLVNSNLAAWGVEHAVNILDPSKAYGNGNPTFARPSMSDMLLPCGQNHSFALTCYEPRAHKYIDSHKMINGKYVKQNTQTMSFKIPLLSGILGYLMPLESYRLLPMAALRNVVLEASINPYTFFTSHMKMNRTGWKINTFKLKVELIDFGPQMESMSLQLLKGPGMQYHTETYYKYSTVQFAKDTSPNQNFQVNMGFQSLKSLFITFHPMDYQNYSCLRKSFRMSHNVTDVQVKIGIQRYPDVAIRGNGGNAQLDNDHVNEGNNSEFYIQLKKAFKKHLVWNAEMVIDEQNFAINNRKSIKYLTFEDQAPIGVYSEPLRPNTLDLVQQDELAWKNLIPMHQTTQSYMDWQTGTGVALPASQLPTVLDKTQLSYRYNHNDKVPIADWKQIPSLKFGRTLSFATQHNQLLGNWVMEQEYNSDWLTQDLSKRTIPIRNNKIVSGFFEGVVRKLDQDFTTALPDSGNTLQIGYNLDSGKYRNPVNLLNKQLIDISTEYPTGQGNGLQPSEHSMCVPIKPQRQVNVANSNSFAGYTIQPTFDKNAKFTDANQVSMSQLIQEGVAKDLTFGGDYQDSRLQKFSQQSAVGIDCISNLLSQKQRYGGLDRSGIGYGSRCNSTLETNMPLAANMGINTVLPIWGMDQANLILSSPQFRFQEQESNEGYSLQTKQYNPINLTNTAQLGVDPVESMKRIPNIMLHENTFLGKAVYAVDFESIGLDNNQMGGVNTIPSQPYNINIKSKQVQNNSSSEMHIFHNINILFKLGLGGILDYGRA